jgi:uncharacterized protein (TIGR03545 family)
MRWKFIGPFAVVAAVVVAFNILFLDMLLKKAVTASGEAVFGAKVEVARLKTKLSDLSINIDGVQIADKSDVWKNLVEIKKVKFAVRPLPLLAAKLNVEEMSVDGIRFGTPRKSSGALPPRKVKKIEKERESDGVASRLASAILEKGKDEVASLPAASSIREAREALGKISPDMVKLDDLEAPRELDKIKEGLQYKYTQNAQNLANLNVSSRLATVSSALSSASKISISSVEEARAALPALENLGKAGETAQNTLNDIAAVRRRIAADFGQEKDILARVEELKNADLKKISDKLRLPSLPSGNFSSALFGNVWIDRVNTAIHYIGLARKYMPAGKKGRQEIKERKRLKGRDIEFPGPKARPKFLVEKISLSGEFGNVESPVSFLGAASDFTSDPVLWGKPATLKLSGSGGGRSLDADAVFDHTSDAPRDSFNIAYRGMDGKSLRLPESEYLPSFEDSRAAVEMSLEFVDDEINARLGLGVSKISYRLASDADESRKMIADLWKGINEIKISALVRGRAGDLKVTLESDIDRILSDRLKGLFGEKLNEARARLRAEVDRLTDAKRAEVMKEYNDKRAAAMDEAAALEKDARARVDEVRARTDEISAKIKEVEDRERKRAEAEKRKAEEALQKQGAEKLGDIQKNLFR